MPLTPGDRFGRFSILFCAGRGGMGEVYKAEDTVLRRVVALKTIRLDTIGATAEESALSLRRFEREGRLLAAFSHPNAMAIYGFEVIDDTPVLVMEWLDGRSLRALIREPVLHLDERLAWLRDAAAALAALHHAGIVHRDLKPANMFVDATGRLRLLDFGLARFVEAGADDPRLTGTHDVIGTPKYMAPEQRFGARVDGRADQFAWGLVAYELITGHHPNALVPDGATFPETAPPSLESLDPRVPPAVGRVVLRALSFRAEQRHPSMDAVVEELDGALAKPPTLTASPPTANLLGSRPAPAAKASRRIPAWVVFAASAAAVLVTGVGAIAAVVRSSSSRDTPVLSHDASPPVPSLAAAPPSDRGVGLLDAAAPDARPSPEGDDDGGVAEPAPPSSARRISRSSERMTYRKVVLGDHDATTHEGALRAVVASREAAVLACYRKGPPMRLCAGTASLYITCQFGPGGEVVRCWSSSTSIVRDAPNGCALSAEAEACVPGALAGASAGEAMPRHVGFRLSPE